MVVISLLDLTVIYQIYKLNLYLNNPEEIGQIGNFTTADVIHYTNSKMV